MSEYQTQVEQNFLKFKELLPGLKDSYGKFALMRNGELTQIYDTFEDALKTAHVFYKDGLFSIQKIYDKPIDLGFRSRAMHKR